ncbi:MAG TPA: dimethylsulfoxide reductase subunit B [Clostridia bacterium]|nr:dimethylsulfoxide reductase subunit B [Clostridia bacterium]
MGKKQLAFYLNQQRCTGCFTCQIACKDKNDLPLGQLFRRVHEVAGGGYTESGGAFRHNVYAYWISLSCNHCQEPLCVKNCPTGAMQKREEDGIVFVDQNRCIGCRYCTWSCPYGAPEYNPEKGKTGKCDFCQDLLERGEPPACVAACPMRALDFGTLEELAQKYGGVNQIKGLPDPGFTKPSLLITPHRDAIL